MPFGANCGGTSLLKCPRPRRARCNVEFSIPPKPHGNIYVPKKIASAASLPQRNARWPGRRFHEWLRTAQLLVEADNLVSPYQEKCAAEIRHALDAFPQCPVFFANKPFSMRLSMRRPAPPSPGRNQAEIKKNQKYYMLTIA
jgi:hypothetical protein